MNARAEITAFLLLAIGCSLVAGDAIGDQCANEFPKLSTCLTFATGKQDTPTKECCTSVSDLKNKNPVCLCYIIQQIHSGSDPQIKSMGIQEARLLQLPSACKLTNASTSECPKLLHLSPSSPDAAIFANSTASTTPSTATPDTSTPTKPNAAFKNGPQLAGPALAIVVAIFFSSSFPTGLALMSSFST
ncbi:unnamed protein product [Coffea canephora]|uniref:Bifunctional inhibitor/plant lipid transfer protein/seed storage helical domain-containing protein n=1 Tax=Coffea canephora TaxID=49390 RepID=A0A068UY50_COFCA|nr:unnamed protein product [Coffea canephora]